jgi:tripartite ATP-independent transporter DctP family solute receptor
MKKISRRAALKTTLVAGGSVLLPRFANAAEFNFKFTSTQPASHPSTIRFIEAAERVKLKSGGKFEVTVFHSGQLGTDIDTFTQVRIGGVQMMVLSNLITATAAPLTSLCSIPYTLPTYDHIWRAMDGKLGALLRADLEKAGYLSTEKIPDDGYHQITSSTKPINDVADLAGFKMRVPPSPLQTSTWRALGAAPASMNFSELYTALQTGVVDGQEGTPSLAKTNRLYEVQKYCSLTSHLWDGWYVLINPRAFKKLPPAMADLLMESYDQAGLDERKDMLELNESARTFMKEKGIIFNTPPDIAPFRKKLADAGFYKEWKEKMGPQAWALLEEISGPLV